MSLDNLENIRTFSFHLYGKTIVVERTGENWKITNGDVETFVVGRDVRTYIAWAKNGQNLTIEELS